MTDNALKVSASLYCLYTTSISHGVEIISPGCGVRASLMLFYAVLMYTFLVTLLFVYSDCKDFDDGNSGADLKADAGGMTQQEPEVKHTVRREVLGNRKTDHREIERVNLRLKQQFKKIKVSS